LNFRSTIAGAAALLGLALAAPAWAQDAADPIGGLLEQVQAAPNPDDPEAESLPNPAADAPLPKPPPAAFTPPVGHAPGPSAQPPQAAAPVAPYAAPYIPPPRPALTEPVHVDETGKTPEAPLSPVEAGYEARLRASFSSAQGLQGPLDGAWTLRGAQGGALYTLLLVDNGMALEGAWRDPRRRGATDASGFLNDIQRIASGVVITFYPAPGAGLATLTLSPAASGAWSGELEERGRRQQVSLKRD
jgi:hypothetical protein